MEHDERAKARAGRDYLFAGALALVAAVVAIADSGVVSGVPTIVAAVAAVVLVVVVYLRVARGFIGRGEDDGRPPVERLRRMALLWLALAVILGSSVLRTPAAAFLEAGAAGLEPRGWAAAGAGIVIVATAVVRAVRIFLARG